MKNGVHLKSTGGTPTINCTSAGVSTVTFGTGATTCDLDGFDITHSANSGAGVHLDGTSGTVSTTISNCTIHDVAVSAGIRLDGVVSCSIEDNTIYDCAAGGISVGQVGTTDDVSNNSSITIKGNTIGDNTNPFDEPNLMAGIYLKGSGTVTAVIGGTGIDANTVCYNGESGMRLDTITNLTIDNNTVNNNTKAGILLIDVGSGSGDAVVKNNDITYSGKAGINIGGDSYLTVGTNNTISNNSTGGIAFNMGDVALAPGSASSYTVTVTGNDQIKDNTYGGIFIKDAISTVNTVKITENDIYSNDRGGIGIRNSCKLEISKNKVRDNVRGGIKTGDDSADPGGFSGTAGQANLDIKQNKIYNNGAGGFGGGMDVRHADGTIYNNLVYKNHRGGIRFGDWIDEIINNTVADNGNAVADRGGGIIYDDISAGDVVNDPPAGNPPATFDIKNNICAYNQKAGIRGGCTNNTVYNLLYGNLGFTGTDCDADVNHRPQNGSACVFRQLGQFCWPLPSGVIFGDPLFVNRAGYDYHLKSTGDGYSEDSPAIDAGDSSYGNDVSLPPGEGTSTIDMGAYGGPLGINW
jgi:hypothetical protein